MDSSSSSSSTLVAAAVGVITLAFLLYKWLFSAPAPSSKSSAAAPKAAAAAAAEAAPERSVAMSSGERAQLCSGSPASAAAEDGGALAASPAPAAAPRSASSSQTLSAARGPPGPFTFTYHDLFLGKAVCIPVLQHLQIAAPLMLVTPALHFARGRAAAGAAPQHPAPPLGCMMVQLWPAQRTRFMFGFTLKACDRASTAPASSQVYFRTASRWSACILQRVMSGYDSKVQVRCAAAHGRVALVLLTRCCSKLRPIIGLDARLRRSAARCMPPPPPAHSPRVPQAAAAARVAGKGSVCDAAEKGDTSLVGDHVLANDKCVNEKRLYEPHPYMRAGKWGRRFCFVLDVLTLLFS
jgi:hypothetical protein